MAGGTDNERQSPLRSGSRSWVIMCCGTWRPVEPPAGPAGAVTAAGHRAGPSTKVHAATSDRRHTAAGLIGAPRRNAPDRLAEQDPGNSRRSYRFVRVEGMSGEVPRALVPSRFFGDQVDGAEAERSRPEAVVPRSSVRRCHVTPPITGGCTRSLSTPGHVRRGAARHAQSSG